MSLVKSIYDLVMERTEENPLSETNLYVLLHNKGARSKSLTPQHTIHALLCVLHQSYKIERNQTGYYRKTIILSDKTYVCSNEKEAIEYTLNNIDGLNRREIFEYIFNHDILDYSNTLQPVASIGSTLSILFKADKVSRQYIDGIFHYTKKRKTMDNIIPLPTAVLIPLAKSNNIMTSKEIQQVIDDEALYSFSVSTDPKALIRKALLTAISRSEIAHRKIGTINYYTIFSKRKLLINYKPMLVKVKKLVKYKYQEIIDILKELNKPSSTNTIINFLRVNGNTVSDQSISSTLSQLYKGQLNTNELIDRVEVGGTFEYFIKEEIDTSELVELEVPKTIIVNGYIYSLMRQATKDELI